MKALNLSVIGLLMVALASCGDDEKPTPAASATEPTAEVLATATVVSPTLQATVSAPKSLTGVFEEPRGAPATRKVTPPAAPVSPFTPWDGKSAVIYDVVVGTEIILGPGSLPNFSPDGTRAVWIAGEMGDGRLDGEVRLVELATGNVRSLGPGRAGYPRFLDDNTVAFSLPGTSNRVVSVDLRSGIQTDISGTEVDRRWAEALQAQRLTTPDGYRVSFEEDPAAPQMPRGGWPWVKVKVTDTRSGRVALAFEAFAAAPAGTGHIVVASKVSGQTVNLFLVEIATGQAQFLSTTRWSSPNFPLVADDRLVAWIDDYCGDPPGNLTIFYRTTKELIEATGVRSYVRLTPSGQLALGEFGARRLLDPATLATVATLPEGSDVSWSSDYRYAAHGVTGGHGGLC